MKTAAIVLIVAVLIVGGLLGYGLFNTSLKITGKSLQTFSATERGNEFEALRIAMDQNSLLGTVLNRHSLGAADEYSYYVYTLRLENSGLVPAEMVEIQIAPIQQDVLFYGPTDEIIIPAGGTRDLWCVLLTKGTPHPVRDLRVTYYLWGHPHEVKYTYDTTN